jgi:uncharacterized RDD family membrane protein YckC
VLKKKKLKYAEFFDRLIAFLIDLILIAIPIFVVILIGIILGSAVALIPALAVMLHVIKVLILIVAALAVIVIFVYNNIHLVATKGASFGKRIMKLKVVDLKGKYPIGYSKALVRLVGKIICFLTLGLGFLLILTDEKRQGLHDRIADTYVIKEE